MPTMAEPPRCPGCSQLAQHCLCVKNRDILAAIETLKTEVLKLSERALKVLEKCEAGR